MITFLGGLVLMLSQGFSGYVIIDLKTKNKDSNKRIESLEARVNDNETKLAVNTSEDKSRVSQLTDIKKSIDEFSKQIIEVNRLLTKLTEKVDHLEKLKEK